MIKESKFHLTIDNKEILKSLIYLLERKFKNVQFEYVKSENVIIGKCVSDESFEIIKETIENYCAPLRSSAHKLKNKIIWSCENKNGISIKNLNDFYSDLDGVQFFNTEHTELLQLIDNLFKKFFQKLGAQEILVPSLISKKNLERCKYLIKEKHQITQLHSLNSGETQACLSPAACLPLYPSLEHKNFNTSAVTYTFKSAVYRHEDGCFSNNPLERNWEYQIRELVCFYSDNKNDNLFKEYCTFMNHFCSHFNISSILQTASDTFFHEESTKMIAHQLLLSKKYETVYLAPGEKEIAISSLNYHDASFTQEFDIKSLNSLSSSLCIGVGLFRTLKAILESNNNDIETCLKLFTDFTEKLDEK